MPRKDANPGQSEAAAERREQAFQLRKLGWSFRAIGRRLGVSHVQAYRDVSSILKELARQTMDAAKELRLLESERLDLLWRRLLPKIKAGDPNAIQAAIRVVQRRCSLFGLDGPKQVEHAGKGGGPIRFRETVRGLTLDQFKALPTAEKAALLRGAMGLPERDA
jgi:hypothetical protein